MREPIAGAQDGVDRPGDGIDERVAVLLCGYGEVETDDDLTDYNARSLRLLVLGMAADWVAPLVEQLGRVPDPS